MGKIQDLSEPVTISSLNKTTTLLKEIENNQDGLTFSLHIMPSDIQSPEKYSLDVENGSAIEGFCLSRESFQRLQEMGIPIHVRDRRSG